MLKLHYPALFAGDPVMREAAADLAHRTFELVSFLTDVLGDKTLRGALGRMEAGGFSAARAAAVARLPEFDALRDRAVEIKNHTLAHLDF
jgi:L-lactate utilization protein LutB